MAYARTRKRNGTRTCETDPRRHTIRTKNALRRGLTTAALRTGRFGVPKPHDAATAPHMPKREGQKLRLLVMKTAPRHAVEAERRHLLRHLPCQSSAGAAASTASLPCPAPGERGAQPASPPPRTGVHRPQPPGCRGMPGRGARALRPPGDGTLRPRPRVPGEGAARGTPAPPSWRPEARRARRREPQGGRPGEEAVSLRGNAGGREEPPARPSAHRPFPAPRPRPGAARACGSPSPERRAGTGVGGEGREGPAAGPRVNHPLRRGTARLPARRGPRALPGACGDGRVAGPGCLPPCPAARLPPVGSA